MKHVKRTPLLIVLCMLSFFSCKPTDIVTPKELKAPELAKVAKALPEFHTYMNTQEEVKNDLLKRLAALSAKDLAWLNYINETYSKPEIFLATAENIDIKRYETLTGVDIRVGNQALKTLFRELILKLQLETNYHPEDLAEILYPDPEETSHEKFFPSCEMYCGYEARKTQRTIYNQCVRVDAGNPLHQIRCAEKAEISFLYFLTKCISKCKGF